MIFVAIGGFFGAICRFLLSTWIGQINKQHFPWSTFLINSSGSFVLGAFFATTPNLTLSYLIATGFLGAFTTFSTFSYETITLLVEAKYKLAIAYVGLSAGVGITGACAGFYLCS